MSAPEAITGVLRPDPLRELSVLLGVHVLDVERWERPGDGRRSWYVEFAADPNRLHRYDTGFFRSPARLNTARCLWARDPNLAPLTKEQCGRVLRLMHEHHESKTGTTYTTTEGMDQ